MARQHPVIDERRVTEILMDTRNLIELFGWERGRYAPFGAAPRCIRKAVWDAAGNDGTGMRAWSPEHVALMRISEAIHDRRGVVGGINDFEYRKKTDKAAVLALIDKAIELGPATPLPMPEGAV